MPESKSVRVVACPTCKAATPWTSQFRPFCSQRCRTVDLGAWADERYRVPSEKGVADEDDAIDDGTTEDER